MGGICDISNDFQSVSSSLAHEAPPGICLERPVPILLRSPWDSGWSLPVAVSGVLWRIWCDSGLETAVANGTGVLEHVAQPTGIWCQGRFLSEQVMQELCGLALFPLLCS